MKLLDIALVLILAFGAYRGYKKGLLVEVVSFFAFIIAIVAALKLMHTGVSYLSPDTSEPSPWLPFIAFLLIFIVVFIAIFFLGKGLKNVLDYTLFGKFDTWTGALVGAAKVAFGVSLVLWLMHHAKINFPGSAISGTYVYPYLVNFAPKVIDWLSYIIPFQDIFSLVQKTIRG